MRRGSFLFFLALAPGACAGPAQPLSSAGAAAPVPAAPSGPTPAASPATDAGPAPPVPSLQLLPIAATPAPNPPPVIEIKFPLFAQVIPAAKAQAYRVRLKVENWPLAARGSGVEIALDEHAPVRVLDADAIGLGSLAAELTSGDHVLVAWAIRETGEIVRPPAGVSRAPFAAVRFAVETPGGKPSGDSPVLRYVSPRGTINGDPAADSLLVDCLPLFVELSPQQPLRVKIEGQGAGAPPWTAELAQPLWAPVGVRGLPSGDWKITLEQGANRAVQVITVNRELAPANLP